MISGDLIDKIRGVNGQNPDFSKLFVLAGFCLVAAVSSRAFIQSVSEKVLQKVRNLGNRVEEAENKVEKVENKAEEAKEQAAEAKEQAAELTELVVDPRTEDETPEELLNDSSMTKLTATPELSNDERAVLRTMVGNSYLLRSITGMAKDSGLEKAKVNAAITSLIAKKLVTQRTSGQHRWYATSLGRKIAENL
jgi:outer membrane murein-binding lipoprotein Lpp